MIARLTTVRVLALSLVAMVVIAAMVALGRWQLGVYDDHQRADAIATMRRPPVGLDSALGPDEAFPAASVGVPVSVEGRYDSAGQLYVRGLPGGKAPYSVVTPLVTASGSAILVVRGSRSSPQWGTPAGPVQVWGILEPSQPTGSGLDGHRITDAINIGSLVGSVGQDLYSGYVVRTASDPPDHLTVVAPPLPSPSRWAGVRNLLYAVQWWVFAGFVAFMWWRVVTDTAGAQQGDPAEAVDAETVG